VFAVLGLGAAGVIALDVVRVHRGTQDPGRWLLVEAAVMGIALVIAWQWQEELRLVPLLVLAVFQQAALIGVLSAHGFNGDHDTGVVYTQEGHTFLHGVYPASEYPTGAVLLFAFERAVGGRHSVWVANALVMVGCSLVVTASIWSLRTRWSGWLAAFVALWPVDAFVSQLRFDLAVAALLAVGLALAWRERFVLAGLVFGLGAALKWTPALTALALLVWLVASGKKRQALECAAGVVATFALLTVPFLAWSASAVVEAYRKQAVRTITGESLPYLPLHWLGLAHLGRAVSLPAAVPGWANGAVTALQIGLLVGVLVLAALARGSLRAGITVAGLAPVVFLLGNRVFSAQFVLVLLTAWTIGIALLARSRRQQFALATAAAFATLANVFVFPYSLRSANWQACSVALFAAALGLTSYLLYAAFMYSRTGAWSSRPSGTDAPSLLVPRKGN
jgi:hypothetical protein